MNRSRDEINKRREALMDIISQSTTDKLDIEKLSSELDVSPVTIRRDLVVLESRGLIKRNYGKVSAEIEDADGPANAGKNDNNDVIDRIAEKAAEFVEDGDIIFLNTSSTALRMLSFIRASNVTVITNNILAANTPHKNDLTLIFTGGEVRYPKYAMVGDIAQRTIMAMTAHKSFLGCSGLTIENGMTTEYLSEVGVNELMLSKNAGQVFIVTNHTKLGANSNFTSGSIHQIMTLITDDEADPAIIDQFRTAGLKVIQV